MIALNLTEHEEQCNLIGWLDRHNIGRMAVPNGGKRGKAEAVRLKREGVLPGAPDIVLIDFAPYVGKPVAIEMKRKTGARYSPEQLAVHARMRTQGWIVIAPPSGQSAQYVIEELKKLGFG